MSPAHINPQVLKYILHRLQAISSPLWKFINSKSFETLALSVMNANLMKSAALTNAKLALVFLFPLQTPFCLASILAWSNELLKLQKSPFWLFGRKNGVKMANEGMTFLVRVVTFKLAFLASAAVLKSSSSATDNEGRRSGVIATSTTWNLVRKDRCVADQLWVQYYNYCRLIFAE